MAIVTIRYWAAAKEAAGVAEHELTAETNHHHSVFK